MVEIRQRRIRKAYFENGAIVKKNNKKDMKIFEKCSNLKERIV